MEKNFIESQILRLQKEIDDLRQREKQLFNKLLNVKKAPARAKSKKKKTVYVQSSGGSSSAIEKLAQSMSEGNKVLAELGSKIKK